MEEEKVEKNGWTIFIFLLVIVIVLFLFAWYGSVRDLNQCIERGGVLTEDSFMAIKCELYIPPVDVNR